MMMNKKRLLKNEFPDAKLNSTYEDGKTYTQGEIKIFTNLEDEIKFTSDDEIILHDTLLKEYNDFIKERNSVIAEDDEMNLD